jgi:hypothetical protein
VSSGGLYFSLSCPCKYICVARFLSFLATVILIETLVTTNKWDVSNKWMKACLLYGYHACGWLAAAAECLLAIEAPVCSDNSHLKVLLNALTMLFYIVVHIL